MPSRVEHAEALIFAGQRLFSTLAGWLHVRQQRVRRCTLHLLHDDGASSAVPLHFAEASAEEGRFLRLLREHLGRLTLRAPVEALRLQADELADRPADSAHLFEQAPSGEGALACLERLRARLGKPSVRALALVADYRPECATREQDPLRDTGPSTAGEAPPGRPRPLWLLPHPQLLHECVVARCGMARSGCYPRPSAWKAAGGMPASGRRPAMCDATISLPAIRSASGCGFFATPAVVPARPVRLKGALSCRCPLMPSCIASPISASCAVPRTRTN